MAYESKGDLDKAIADYTKAIELDLEPPTQLAGAYMNRGIIYAGRGDLEQAIADYTKAIELDPKNADRYYNRGLAYRQKDLKEQAIADFEMYLQLAPDAPDRVQIEQWLSELIGCSSNQSVDQKKCGIKFKL